MQDSTGLTVDGNNQIELGKGVLLVGKVVGRDNIIRIGDAYSSSTIKLNVVGDGNKIEIGAGNRLPNTIIQCGTRESANECQLTIGANFWIEAGGRFLLHTSGNRCDIGDDCLFSSSVTIRCGEHPHLLFDMESGEYLDHSDGVFIGGHVWVGEQVYVTKRATIPTECVVAARAVVTRRFAESHSVIGGNPAEIVRSGIQWYRGQQYIEEGNKFQASYLLHRKKFEH